MPWCEVLGGGCCCGLVLEGDHYLLSLNLLGLKGSIDELTRDQWFDHQYFRCLATMDVLLSDVFQRRNMNLICVLCLLEMHRTPYKRQGISSSMLNSLKVQAQMHSDAFPKDFRFQVLYSKMQLSASFFFFFEKRRCVKAHGEVMPISVWHHPCWIDSRSRSSFARRDDWIGVEGGELIDDDGGEVFTWSNRKGVVSSCLRWTCNWVSI